MNSEPEPDVAMRSEVAFCSASELCTLLRRREVSAIELVDLYIERIERHDRELNAVVLRDFERARNKARSIDADRGRGDARPLLGLPITVKESFNVEGLKTTWGSPRFANHFSSYTAEAVARLEQAGAILLGKTNVPLFLQDYQSYNEIYGTTRNPYDQSRTSGGSSGGGAAAVAAGLTGADFGSDLAGSLRVPASFCGVYSHKPSFGIVPTFGHSLSPYLAPPDLSVVGPLARSAEGLGLLLAATAGPSMTEATGWQLKLPPPTFSSLANLRVAILLDVDICPIDPVIRQAVLKLGRWLSAQGATVSMVGLPFDAHEHDALFAGLVKGVLSGRMDEATFNARLKEAAACSSDDTGPAASAARDFTQSHWLWSSRNEARYRLREQWRRFFEDYDLLLMPGTPTPAFVIDESSPQSDRTIEINGRTIAYDTQAFWQGLATVSYLPATIAPIALSESGLPLSVQIVGPYLHDMTTIAIAREVEISYCSFQPPDVFTTSDGAGQPLA
jgi:amidase